MEEVLAFCALLAFAVFVLGGCDETAVYPKDVRAAESRCIANGGWAVLLKSSYKTRCVDGTEKGLAPVKDESK